MEDPSPITYIQALGDDSSSESEEEEEGDSSHFFMRTEGAESSSSSASTDRTESSDGEYELPMANHPHFHETDTTEDEISSAEEEPNVEEMNESILIRTIFKEPHENELDGIFEGIDLDMYAFDVHPSKLNQILCMLFVAFDSANS